MANPPPIPHPAALPRHLEKVILNTHRHTRERAVMDGHRDDNSVLPIPNHVVLNHLGTSAIKNGVLAVATTMRYHQKVCSNTNHEITNILTSLGSISRLFTSNLFHHDLRINVPPFVMM